ncbi:MAG: DUF115 domain-containing protein [Deltaproteobacteria bacterium]
MLKLMLAKTYRTFKKDGVAAVFTKSLNRIYSMYKRINVNDAEEVERWRHLKNKYTGKRAFIVGNGPSLNKTPLYLLKNEYTMCFNRFFIMNERINWDPTFYATTDNIVLSDILGEVVEFIPRTHYSFLPDIHFRGDNYIEKIGRIDNLYWLQQQHGEGFSQDLPKIFPGGTVIYEGFQILRYLGFQEIYLVGVDLNYKIHDSVKYLKKRGLDIESQKDDDPNHFDPRYFGKNKKYHQPEETVVQNIFRNLKYLSGILPELDLKIINAGYDSKLDYFPKADFLQVVDLSSQEREDLFLQCLSKASEYRTIHAFESKNPRIDGGNHFQPSNEADFFIDLEGALPLIPKAIFTHIPIGPFDHKYYFIRRRH